MTVDTTQAGGVVAPANLYAGLNTGLEDIDSSDLTTPRLTIDHKEAVFKDSLSGQTFETLTVVILGPVKQRIMWAPKVGEDNPQPMCKSTDFKVGFPNLDPESKKEDRFPIDQSNFSLDRKTLNVLPDPAHHGMIHLDCGSCRFKDWGTHPMGNKPWCAEVYTFSVLYDPDGVGAWVPAILAMKGSAIKPTRTYISTFARSGTPMFTSYTQLSLQRMARGTNDYCVPKFVKLGQVPQEEWQGYSDSYVEMRDFLTAWPTPRSDDDDTPAQAAPGQANNGWNSAPQQPTVVQGQTVPQPAPQAQPVAQPVATPAPAPVAQPVATPAPAPVAQPVATPAPQAATPAPAPVTPAPAAVAAADDDEMPF